MTLATEHIEADSPGGTGLALFLVSEMMFFVALAGGFLVLKAGNGELFAAMAPLANRLVGAGELAMLAAATVAIFLAKRLWTLGFAAVYLALLALDYWLLWRHVGLPMSRNPYLAEYFVLTSAHALHVVGGMIATGIAVLWKIQGPVNRYLAIYWAFVAVVGCMLYPLLHFA